MQVPDRSEKRLLVDALPTVVVVDLVKRWLQDGVSEATPSSLG